MLQQYINAQDLVNSRICFEATIKGRVEQGHATLLCSFFLASCSAFHWLNAAMPSSDS
jgi:hypothetical protein